jgi:glycosyltransferase involved in cell wall biosynthesis
MLYRPLVNYLNEKADYIYSYGGGVTDLIRKNIPGSEKKVIEIPAGIEPEWIFEGNKKIHQPLHFAFLGRYDIRKGVLELSKALQNLAGKTSFEFHFIGPVPEELKLNSPQIRYHGEIREAEKIKSILRDADVFVLPSHSEGMPNVILEAMASGCAVLATRVGAVDVMVDESNGWLIPPMDAKSIEEKMQHILGMEPAAIEKKKMRSVEKIKHQFLWDEVVKLEMQAIKKISGS